MSQPTSDDLAGLRVLGQHVQMACRAVEHAGSTDPMPLPPGFPEPNSDPEGFSKKFMAIAAACSAACAKWVDFFMAVDGVEAIALETVFTPPPPDIIPKGVTGFVTPLPRRGREECTSPIAAVSKICNVICYAIDKNLSVLQALVFVENRNAIFVAFQRALARAERQLQSTPPRPDGTAAERRVTFAQARDGVPALGLPPTPERTLRRWLTNFTTACELGVEKEARDEVRPALMKPTVAGLLRLQGNPKRKTQPPQARRSAKG